MSRLTDVKRPPHAVKPLPLPVIDWRRIGHSAPVPVEGTYDGSDAPLPKADVVVMTWTSAEWSAFDHVFLNSSSTRSSDDRDWEKAWHQYSHNAVGQQTDNTSAPLWGLYRLVDMPVAGGKTLRVLLYKSDAHLAHSPWLAGLSQMLGQILDETGAEWVWSIGTAGGSRETERLGDVIITNAGHIQLQKSENDSSPINNQTFTGKAFPSDALYHQVQEELFFRMNSVVTWPTLENLLYELHEKDTDSQQFTLEDFVNPPLDPKNLKQSRVLPMDGTPLLTTDYYYIATGEDSKQWAVLEMDDAVIASVAEQKGRKYAFARNISDPIVPNTAKNGTAISDDIRGDWSGNIYNQFGLYTSFNGALATWAAITATK